MNRKLISGLIVLCTAVVAVIAFSVIAAESGSPSEQGAATGSAPRVASGFSRELFHFDDLATMTATSQLVVDASVIRTEPGVGGGSGHAQEAYTNGILNINEVLYGNAPSRTLTVEMVSEAAGQPIELDGLEPLQQNDSGVFFLRPSVHGSNWVLTNSQGRYLTTTEGNLKGAKQDDALIKRLSTRSRGELKAEIAAARASIEAGKVKPKTYPPGAPGAPG